MNFTPRLGQAMLQSAQSIKMQLQVAKLQMQVGSNLRANRYNWL